MLNVIESYGVNQWKSDQKKFDQGVEMNTQSQKLDLDELASLSGFPVELIKKELFADQENMENLSIDDLRTAMVKYLDSTMLN